MTEEERLMQLMCIQKAVDSMWRLHMALTMATMMMESFAIVAQAMQAAAERGKV